LVVPEPVAVVVQAVAATPDPAIGTEDQRAVTDARVARAGMAPQVASGAVGDVRVVALTVHRIARILGALVVVAAIDACAKHGVHANDSAAYAGKTAKVAGRADDDIGVVALAVRWVAGVHGTFVVIIAVDVRAERAAANSTRA